jgi:hypothetical protein
MRRSFSLSSLISLPPFSTVSTARLLYELRRCAKQEQKLRTSIPADRDEPVEARKGLFTALKERLFRRPTAPSSTPD